MNPIYKFELAAGSTNQQAFPIYNDSMAKDFEKESGQEFFRAKLSGELIFKSADYSFIVQQAFDEQFTLKIFISYDAGVTWALYWTGAFWKTDCKFDEDSRTVTVKPSVVDKYTDVLAGLDKEYNLIDLAPQIVSVKADKRPMIQVYVPGQMVIGCFLSGMWWEQECEAESDETKLAQTGNGKLNFAINKSLLMADVSGNMSPQLPELLTGTITGGKFNLLLGGTQSFQTGDYILQYYWNGQAVQRWSILRASDSTVLWQSLGGGQIVTQLPVTVTLYPQNGAAGNVTLYIHQTSVYSRYICDTDAINNVQTFEIGSDDIVEDNRNYRRVIGYYFPDTIFFSSALTETPTKWGLYQPGQYYAPPYVYWNPEFFPVARNAWGRVSLWFTFSSLDWAVERSGRKAFQIRHAYPLFSVISVLLGKIATGITHDGTTEYSQFLYGENLIGINQSLLITPKSNIVTAGYDQPAQSAPITLREILDMLRQCFRCYWFIDETGRFRIEHIEYFRNGGSYYGSQVVGIDLTTQIVQRNGKPWAFARNQYQFDKPSMPERYQFGWADEVTQLFKGYPINVISKFVSPGNIEEITVSKFTSDLDYILLNPSAVSKDGFVLLASKSVSFTELLTNPLTYSWNGGAIQTSISLTAYRGMTMRISVNTSRQILTVSQSGGGVSQLIGQIANEPNVTKTFEFVVEPTAEYIILYGPQPGGAAISSLQVMVGEYELPYVNYVVDGNDHYLQNAWVAFCILQNYYAFDMPAPEYEINGVHLYATGVKRLKMQTINFPVLNDPNLLQLVKTNLGNGTIEKISVNLSSRNANATLKYDTE